MQNAIVSFLARWSLIAGLVLAGHDIDSFEYVNHDLLAADEVSVLEKSSKASSALFQLTRKAAPDANLLQEQRVGDHEGGSTSMDLFLSEIQDMITQKGSSGLDAADTRQVQQMQALINDSIFPGIFAGLSELQGEIDEMFDAIMDCQLHVSTSLSNIHALETVVKQYKTEHKECRAREEYWYNEMTKICSEFSTFRVSLHLPADLPGPQSTDRQVLDYLKTMGEYFGPLSEIYEAKYATCQAYTTNYTSVQTECTESQSDYEESLCTLRTRLTETCSMHNTCWSSAVTRYNVRRQTVESMLQQKRTEFEAAAKMECLLGSWNWTLNPCIVNDTLVESCNSMAPNVTNITVTWPDVPTPVECSTDSVSVYPCTDAFVDEEYRTLGLRETVLTSIVDSCRACTALDIGQSSQNDAKWISANAQKTALNLFVKTHGSTHSWDAYAYTKYANVYSVSVKIGQHNANIVFGLTSNADDDTYFAHGYHIKLLPDALVQLGASDHAPIQLSGAQGMYAQNDEFTLSIDGSVLSAFKGTDLIYAWEGVSQGAMHAKIWILQVGASVQITNLMTISQPFYYDLMELGEPVQLVLPCDVCEDQTPDALTEAAQHSCESKGAEAVLCGCFQVFCSQALTSSTFQSNATDEALTSSTFQSNETDEASASSQSGSDGNSGMDSAPNSQLSIPYRCNLENGEFSCTGATDFCNQKKEECQAQYHQQFNHNTMANATPSFPFSCSLADGHFTCKGPVDFCNARKAECLQQLQSTIALNEELDIGAYPYSCNVATASFTCSGPASFCHARKADCQDQFHKGETVALEEQLSTSNYPHNCDIAHAVFSCKGPMEYCTKKKIACQMQFKASEAKTTQEHLNREGFPYDCDTVHGTFKCTGPVEYCAARKHECQQEFQNSQTVIVSESLN